MGRHDSNITAPQFACFTCRKAFKKLSFSNWCKQKGVSHFLILPQEEKAALDRQYMEQMSVCPQCQGAMVIMGGGFRPPKQKDTEAWAIVQALFERGYNFRINHDGKVGYTPPKKLADLPEFFAQMQPLGYAKTLLQKSSSKKPS